MNIQQLTRSTFVLWALLFSSNWKAQSWQELISSPNPNFFEVQEAFYKEWKDKEYISGQGIKQFKRWEWFWESRILPDGSLPMQSKEYEDFVSLLFSKQNSKANTTGNWFPMGPDSPLNTDYSEYGRGRINCVAVDPNDPNKIYVGAPSGGVWKSTDAGQTWTPISDFLSSIGVSGITIDPNNSDIIYLATGDSDGNDSYSIGVVKSTDGGLTWNTVGNYLSFTTSEILIDPTNSNVLWLATGSGVMKSTDSGLTWVSLHSANCEDIAFKPGDPNTVYSVSNDEFFKTTDGGATWTQIFNGLPSSSIRMKIAVSAAAPDYVYLLSASGNSIQPLRGLYRSTDSGNTFTAMTTTAPIFELSNQLWYNMALTVSPNDPNEVYTGALNIWRSFDGGVNFTKVSGHTPTYPYTHVDIHFLKFYNGELFCGTDGGVYKSTDHGNSFDDLSKGLHIGQFYRIAGMESSPESVAGGLQDNGGTVLEPYYGWFHWHGGDGMECGFNRNDPSQLFGMSQYGELHGSGLQGYLGSPETGSWVTPMAMDPNNDRLLAGYSELYEYDYVTGWNQLSYFTNPGGMIKIIEIYEGNSDVIFISDNSGIFKSTDGGANFIDITNGLVTSWLDYISSIEVNPSDENELWATVSQEVFHTTNGGLSWSNMTNNLPNIHCNIIKHDSRVDGAVYVGTDLGVYYYDEEIGSWMDFGNNLPNVTITDLEINETHDFIRAGTYGRGMWESACFNSKSADAGISEIISPISEICFASTTEPVVELRNYAGDDLTSVIIHYSLDGGNVQTYTWTGLLIHGASQEVTLPSIVTNQGPHTFEAWTTMPNNTVDEESTNDSKSSSFDMSNTGVFVDYELYISCIEYDNSWAIKDDQNNVLFSDDYFSGNGFGVNVSETYCLTDGCYTYVINDTDGNGIAEIGTSGGSGSCPDGNYSITDDQGNILVQMTNANFGYQAIHNFCINTGVSVDDRQDEELLSLVEVYPNPNNGNFSIHTNCNQNFEIVVLDALGQQITKATSINNQIVNLDLSDYSRGVYFVRIILNKSITTKRVVLEK